MVLASLIPAEKHEELYLLQCGAWLHRTLRRAAAASRLPAAVPLLAVEAVGCLCGVFVLLPA